MCYSLLVLALLIALGSCSIDIEFTKVEHPAASPTGLTFNARFYFEIIGDECGTGNFDLSIDDEKLSASHYVCHDSALYVTFEDIKGDKAGFKDMKVRCSDCQFPSTISSRIFILPGFLTLLPPLVTITLAVTTAQVVPSLLIGVFIASYLSCGSLNPVVAFRWTFDYFVNSIADPSYAKVAGFFIFLGAVIGLISKSGGSQGLAKIVTRVAKTSKSSQFGLLTMMCLLIVDEFVNIFCCVCSSSKKVNSRV
ncbi:hypothetical protein GEMRC1_012629 [Eukaryota sp. GEM-RC1]